MQERIYPDINQLFGAFVPPPMEPGDNQDPRQGFNWSQFEDLVEQALGAGARRPSAPQQEPDQNSGDVPSKEDESTGHRDNVRTPNCCHCRRGSDCRRGPSSTIPDEVYRMGQRAGRSMLDAAKGLARVFFMVILLTVLPRPLLALGVGATVGRSMGIPAKAVLASGLFWIVLMTMSDILFPLMAGMVFLRCCVMNTPLVEHPSFRNHH